jgi:hypothetical protein
MSVQSNTIALPSQIPAGVAPASVAPARSPSLYVSGKTAVLVAPAMTVLATILVGSVVLTVMGAPLYALEMFLSGLINLSGGLAAAMVILVMMRKGVIGVAQAGIVGIALRCGTVLMGLLLVQSSPMAMDRMVLVYWALGFYFPMLIVETALIAWLSNNLPD